MKSSQQLKSIHEPVLVNEVLEGLKVDKNAHSKKFIDATLGTAGHAIPILKKGGSLLGIDTDERMLKVAEKRLAQAYPTSNKDWGSYKLVKGNFKDIKKIALENGFDQVDGIILDLGVSNLHLTDPLMGFSFGNPEAPLDMRLDTENQGVTAADLLNVLRRDQLTAMFEVTLNRGSAIWLASNVVRKRDLSPVKTVGDFLEICSDLRSKPGLNPATLPFLALRIAVNSELANVTEVLPKAYELLKKGGRLVVISFHSGEDSLVKDYFKSSGGKVITDKPIVPDPSETSINPRSRSAKMRVLEKL